ncbi:hypothetical protein Nepgr_011142 [Nepenthes gracilis]|uniref:BHLH domain-containing protein n=1 Tax=Nepenthes gracilis TaxID=150966 RepID=A0AAD3XM40_NEPGR|nr:hypothetical protein Nepgr_011142 [Nepenthes gracilis]
MEESMIKKALKCLCLSNGWSYGVFWRFDRRNPLLLTLEEAYCEDHVGNMIDDMLLQVHLLGEGIIGQAAFDGKNRWMFSHTSSGKSQFTGHLQSQDEVEENSELCRQFSSGIKTVAVIPVESQGVVQFGSTQEILEEAEFMDQTRKLIQETDNCAALPASENASSSLNRYTSGPNQQFSTIISSQNSLNCYPEPVYDNHNTNSTPLDNTLASISPCINMWLTSFGQQEVSPVMLTPNVSTTLTRELQNFHDDSLFDSLFMEGGDPSSFIELIEENNFGSLIHETMGRHEEEPTSPKMFEEFKLDDSAASLFSPFQVDDLFNWLGTSSEPCIAGLNAVIAMIYHMHYLPKQPDNSSQSSIVNAFDSRGEGRSLDFVATQNDLCHVYGPDFACENLMADKMNHLGTDVGVSECNSGSCISGTWKGLFSELGLEQLLNDGTGACCITKSGIDQSVNKKRRIENFCTVSNQIETINHSWRMNSVEPTYNLRKRDDEFGLLKDCMHKSQVGSWVDGRYSVSAKSCVTTTQPKRAEELANANKKRARPGESTRPRPKDRQMIQDRVKELREIIPNGAKCSIDSLLDRTIKHMLFLQNVTKYVDKLKRIDEPKLIGRENSVAGNHKPNNGGGSCGATWALEVGAQNLFCPIIVEDLSHPGQMLIEMLCEDRGFFLEIADLIRGFGLIILKGVMEVRHEKIWAHFIVEAKKHHITRMDIFVPLVQLMRDTATSAMNTTNEPGKAHNSATTPILSNYRRPLLSCLPVSLAETLR